MQARIFLLAEKDKNLADIKQLLTTHPDLLNARTPQDNETLLIIAAKKNAHANANYFLEKQLDINAVDKYSSTALNWAAYSGHLDLVKTLAAQTPAPDLSISSIDYHQPLLAAVNRLAKILQGKNLDATADKNRIDIIEFLLANYSDPAGTNRIYLNAQDKKTGQNALHFAVKLYGIYPRLLDVLLNNCKDSVDLHTALITKNKIEAQTPLNMALALNYHEAADKLIQAVTREADYTKPIRESKEIISAPKKQKVIRVTNEIHNPFFYAILDDDLSAVKAFIAEDNSLLEVTANMYHAKPLHAAVDRGSIKVLKYLISQGANIESRAIHGVTPLGHAIEKAQTRCVLYLIKKGAKLHDLNKEGFSALHMAAVTDRNVELAGYLFSKYRLDPNQQSFQNKITPLRIAAAAGKLKMVKLFIEEFKVDCNSIVDCWHSTALNWAALEAHLPVVKYLVEEAKANVTIPSSHNHTALLATVRPIFHDIAKMLKTEPAGDQPRQLAAYLNRWENNLSPRVKSRTAVIEYLIKTCTHSDEQHPNALLISTLDEYNATVLHYAISINVYFPDFLATVLSAANAQDVQKALPVKCKRQDIACTALHEAVRLESFAAFKLLVDKSTTILGIKNASGLTPVDLARRNWSANNLAQLEGYLKSISVVNQSIFKDKNDTAAVEFKMKTLTLT